MSHSFVTASAFNDLFNQVMQVDLFGKAPSDLPFQDAGDAGSVGAAIESGIPYVPLAFQGAYVNPLLQNLSSVLTQLDGDVTAIETISGAVYQHADSSVRPHLHRFLAVISNLFRSFLSKQKRSQADFPLVELLPPMAMFQHDGKNGPFTLPVNDITRLSGGSCGVVSMPATYKEHPFLWSALSHETGGHDVTHADPACYQSSDREFGGFSVVHRAEQVTRRLGSCWGCCGTTGWTRRPRTCMA